MTQKTVGMVVIGVVFGFVLGFIAFPVRHEPKTAAISSRGSEDGSKTAATSTEMDDPFRPSASLVFHPLIRQSGSCEGINSTCLGRSLKSVSVGSVVVDAILKSIGGGSNNPPKIDIVTSFPTESMRSPLYKMFLHVPDLAYTTMAGGAPDFTATAVYREPRTNQLTGDVFVKLSIPTGEFTSHSYLFRCTSETADAECTELSYDLVEGGY